MVMSLWLGFLAHLVCLCVSVRHPAKADEPIEMPYGVWTPVSPIKYVLGERVKTVNGNEHFWGASWTCPDVRKSTYSAYTTLFANTKQRCGLYLQVL